MQRGGRQLGIFPKQPQRHLGFGDIFKGEAGIEQVEQILDRIGCNSDGFFAEGDGFRGTHLLQSFRQHADRDEVVGLGLGDFCQRADLGGEISRLPTGLRTDHLAMHRPAVVKFRTEKHSDPGEQQAKNRHPGKQQLSLHLPILTGIHVAGRRRFQ